MKSKRGIRDCPEAARGNRRTGGNDELRVGDTVENDYVPRERDVGRAVVGQFEPKGGVGRGRKFVEGKRCGCSAGSRSEVIAARLERAEVSGDFRTGKRAAPKGHFVERSHEWSDAIALGVAEDGIGAVIVVDAATQSGAEAQDAIDIYHLESAEAVISSRNVVQLAVLQGSQCWPAILTVEGHVQFTVGAGDGEAERKNRAGGYRWDRL